MADFDGVIDPAASWADVERLSSEALALGGEGGPMNAQAVALAARTKLLKESIEGLGNDLADTTDPEKGAAMVGLAQGGAVSDAIKYVTPEMFGAVGDGAQDDTTAVQAAFDYGFLQLRRGAVYLVSNLTIPDIRNFTLIGNHARIKKSADGDSHYLCSSIKYLNNVAEAGQPIRIENVAFDGAGEAEYPLIIQNWNSYIDVETYGGTKSGLKFTAETRDGTTFPTSTLVNSRFLLHSHHNGGCGLLVKDPLRNNATDGYVLPGSYIHNNGDYAAYIESGAGWDVHCNTYGNMGGVGFDSVGTGTRVHSSYLDDGIKTVEALPESGLTYSAALFTKAVIGAGYLLADGNTFGGPVTCLGNGDTGPRGIYSKGNSYLDRGGREAFIYHQFFGATRKIVSEGDVFSNENPFRWHNASSPGIINIINSFVMPWDRHVSGSFNGISTGAYIKTRRSDWSRDPAFGLISNGGPFSMTTPVPDLGNFSQAFGLVFIKTKVNWNGSNRVSYLGMLTITSKSNGVDAWTASLDDIEYESGQWTGKPTATVSDNGDGTGTVTISGEPVDSDGFGRPSILWLR